MTIVTDRSSSAHRRGGSAAAQSGASSSFALARQALAAAVMDLNEASGKGAKKGNDQGARGGTGSRKNQPQPADGTKSFHTPEQFQARALLAVEPLLASTVDAHQLALRLVSHSAEGGDRLTSPQELKAAFAAEGYTVNATDEQMKKVFVAMAGVFPSVIAPILEAIITEGILVVAADTMTVSFQETPNFNSYLVSAIAAHAVGVGMGGVTEPTSAANIRKGLDATGFATTAITDDQLAFLVVAYGGSDGGKITSAQFTQAITDGALVLTESAATVDIEAPGLSAAMAQSLATKDGGDSLGSVTSFVQALESAGFDGDITDAAYLKLFTTYAGADGRLNAAGISQMLTDRALVLSPTGMTMAASPEIQPPYDPLASYRPLAEQMVINGSRDDGYLSSYELADAIRITGYQSNLSHDELQFIVNAYDGANSGFIDSTQLATMLTDGALQLKEGVATIDAQNPALFMAFSASIAAHGVTPGMLATPEELQSAMGFSGFARLPADPLLLAVLFKAYAGDDGMSSHELEQMLLEGTLQLGPDFTPQLDMDTATAVNAMTKAILGGASLVNAAQLTAGLSSLGTQHLSPAQSQVLVQSYDADRSGDLDAADLALALKEGALQITCSSSGEPVCDIRFGLNQRTTTALISTLMSDATIDGNGNPVISTQQLQGQLNGLGFSGAIPAEEMAALAARYGTGGAFTERNLRAMLGDGAMSLDAGAVAVDTNVLRLPEVDMPAASTLAADVTAQAAPAFSRRQLQAAPEPTSTALVVEVPSASGSYTVEVNGGIWSQQYELILQHPELRPLIRNPELIDLSKQYVAELRSGKTLQQILQTTPNQSPTPQEQDAMEQALELLGISNRQVQVMASIAGKNNVDKFWGNPLSTGNAALAALRQAGHMRMAIDDQAGLTLRNYVNDDSNLMRWNPNDLPGLSLRSFINALHIGCKNSGAYYFPNDAARDIVFGTGHVNGGIFGSGEGQLDDYRNEGFADHQGFKADGVASLSASTLTQKSAGALTPPSRVTAAAQALRTGATIEDVDNALRTTGITDGHTRTIIIEDALDELGVSNDDIAILAEQAGVDIQALGAEGVNDYLNNSSGDFSRPALDKLFAALQTRFQMDGTETGEAAPAQAVAGKAVVGYDAAVGAAREAGLTRAVLSAMPIGIAEQDGMSTKTTRIGSDRTELSDYDEPAANAHADKGREALGLDINGDQAISADAVNGIASSLGAIFSSTDENWNEASLTQLFNASGIVFEAVGGSVAANSAMLMSKGVPSTVEGASQLNADAINAALSARSLGNLTHEQITRRLYSALNSQAFLDHVATLPDSQRADYANSQLNLLKYFDPMLAQITSEALNEASQPDGVSLFERRSMLAEHGDWINRQSFSDLLDGQSAAQKTGVISVFIATVLGIFRQGLAAGGKANELLSLKSVEKMQTALQTFVNDLPANLTPAQLAARTLAYINESPNTVEAGRTPEQVQIFEAMRQAHVSYLKLPGSATAMSSAAQVLAVAAAATRVSSIAAKFTAGDSLGAVSQAIALVADSLSQAGAAVKLYKVLPEGHFFKGLEYVLGGWATLEVTNPVARLFKPVIELGSAYSQAAYSVQSLYAGIVNMTNKKYAKGAVLISRGAFFLNSYLLLAKAGPYRQITPATLGINVVNSLIIAVHNTLLAGLWKGE